MTDDYVAELLKKDAAAKNTKYLTSGLGAFLTERPTSSAPKPNTRFLRNIIRETDSHNAALLEKEAEDSKARLRALQRDRKRVQPEQSLYSARPRHEEQVAKRKRDNGEEDGSTRKRRETENPRRWLGALDGLGARKDRRAGKDSAQRGNEDTRDSRHGRHRHSTHGGRSHSRESEGDRESRREHKHGERRKRRGSPGRPVDARTRRRRSGSPFERLPTKATGNGGHVDRQDYDSASDSDPLEAIIGPAPPPKDPPTRSKGRGVFTHSGNTMDSRFQSGYDPKADVALDPGEDDDWDMALEALRDRQKWKTQGADRLRAAGFTDEEVVRWKKGGEKDENDVRWSKKGEGREWDRGKVVDDDGEHVELKADWARSKDT